RAPHRPSKPLQFRRLRVVSVLVARLARHDHSRVVALAEHARLHGLDHALAGACERLVYRAVSGELLEVLDRGEDECEPALAEFVEGALRTQPACADALLPVGRRLRTVGCSGDEEPGVESDLHLAR